MKSYYGNLVKIVMGGFKDLILKTLEMGLWMMIVWLNFNVMFIF